MGSCTNLWKALLIITNTIFWLLGCAVIGCATWMWNYSSDPYDIFHLFRILLSNFLRAFIIIGIVTVLTSFFAFWGVIAEKKWMLKLYASIVIVIVIIQIGIALVIPTIFVNEDDYRLKAQGVENYETEFVDSMQRAMKCCGYYHPQEYLNISGLYPPSCCDRSGKAISLCIEPYPTGCWPRFVEVATKYGVAYGGFVGFEVLCVIAAFCVTSSISKKRKRSPSYSRMS